MQCNLDVIGSCNKFVNLSGRIAPNKWEDENLKVFNMITKTNKSKTLIKNILCDCKCKFNGRKCISNQKWVNDKC